MANLTTSVLKCPMKMAICRARAASHFRACPGARGAGDSPTICCHNNTVARSNGADDVKSPLAGRIIAIAVQGGHAVKEGDNLLTVEAMKMNTSVNSPKAGTVAEILTTVGSAVDEGQALIRLS